MFKTTIKVGVLVGLLLTVTPARSATVEMTERGTGIYSIPVEINGAVRAPFLLDTGASSVVLSAKVFQSLVLSGTIYKNDYIGNVITTLADGSKRSSELYRLREVKVGGFTIRNVEASVDPSSDGHSLLLGQSFLSRLPPWTIDYQRHVLVINEEVRPQPTMTTTPPAPKPVPTLQAPIAGPNTVAGTDNIMKLIDLQSCEAPKLLDGFLQAKGSRHSGNPDIWVADYGKLSCAGWTGSYCGTAGCLMRVFIYRQETGKYEKIFDDNVRGYRFVTVDGQPAMTLDLHGLVCGLAGSDVCIKTIGMGPRVH